MSTSMREALEQIAAICDRMAGRDNRARSAHMFDVADIARAALSSPARLSEAERREKVRHILDEMLMGTENYFGATDPKREGRIRIATAAIMKATR